MKQFTLLCAIIACLAVSAHAATLTYNDEIFATEGAQQVRYMDITATEGSEEIWKMRINLGAVSNHRNWKHGEIKSFKDVQFGGIPFEYSEEALSSARWGMMRMSEMEGTFSDAGGRTANYYQFTYTRTLATVTDPLNPENVSYVTGNLTYRINAPVVENGGYTTTIEASYVVNNATPNNYTLGGAGAQIIALNLNDAGYFDWAIVNTQNSPTRPNVHNTETLDGHQLYYIEDWYGSTVGNNTHPFIKMIVKDNSLTRDLNMRPGMTFRVGSPNMSLQYYPLATAARGATTVSATVGVNGGTPLGLSQVFGITSLPPGQSATMLYEGLIMAPGATNVVSAADSNVTATTPVYADGVAQTLITITAKNASGLPLAGIPAEDIVVTSSGTGNTIVQPISETDANGQTVAYMASNVAETKTISVTVQETTLDAKPAVQFLNTAVILQYTGADIATADGVMTVTARDILNDKVIWTTNLTRTGNGIKVSSFTNGGTFNYAAPAGNGPGMISIGEPGILGNTFVQVEKSPSAYRIETVTNGTTWEYANTFSILPPDENGTIWPITRTIKNVSDAKATPAGGMNFQLAVNIDQFTYENMQAELGGTSGMNARLHQQIDIATPLLYTAYENVDRAAGNLDPTDIMQGKVVVNNNQFTTGLGMTPGLELGIISDMIAFYPSDLIGSAGIERTATSYLQRLFIVASPRNFMGSSQTVHNAGLEPGATYTVNYAFTANIAAGGSQPDIQPITVTASISPDFTYQNAAITTGDKNCAVLTLTIDDPNGNTTYNINVAQSGTGSLYQIRDTANPLVKELVGSRRTNGIDGSGLVNLLITVEGVEIGGSGEETTSVMVRRLGDVNGNGFVTTDDLGMLNSKLNGVVFQGIINQAFDIDGSGFVTTGDLGLLNTILNGINPQ